MANLLIDNMLYEHVTTYYNKLKKTISKLHKLASSVFFIKKALHENIPPKKILNPNTKANPKKDIMRGYFNKHNDIRLLRLKKQKVAVKSR